MNGQRHERCTHSRSAWFHQAEGGKSSAKSHMDQLRWSGLLSRRTEDKKECRSRRLEG
ncbi:protein of unknown function [Nitrospira japonica]|uniref:Uncharacterized protein n=1 Tax=Nitrospira japonica TaxID=1325564 RepID=A0A1W1I5F7_9BACT|nr:protein of unknown function [Nitrospira japonica]